MCLGLLAAVQVEQFYQFLLASADGLHVLEHSLYFLVQPV